MNLTTNKVQRDYMLAKAYLDTLESEHKELERNYIKTQNIINADGTIPEAIYCIDDEETFERINYEFSVLPENTAHWEKILEAKRTLKQAEQRLIDYGLSFAPIKEREILIKAASHDYVMRQKIIDLVMRLDVSTILTMAR